MSKNANVDPLEARELNPEKPYSVERASRVIKKNVLIKESFQYNYGSYSECSGEVFRGYDVGGYPIWEPMGLAYRHNPKHSLVSYSNNVDEVLPDWPRYTPRDDS